MDGDRTDKALSRIEAALERLDAASARLGGDRAALQARNEDLRGSVRQAIARIDGLLAGATQA